MRLGTIGQTKRTGAKRRRDRGGRCGRCDGRTGWRRSSSSRTSRRRSTRVERWWRDFVSTRFVTWLFSSPQVGWTRNFSPSSSSTNSPRHRAKTRVTFSTVIRRRSIRQRIYSEVKIIEDSRDDELFSPWLLASGEEGRAAIVEVRSKRNFSFQKKKQPKTKDHRSTNVWFPVRSIAFLRRIWNESI